MKKSVVVLVVILLLVAVAAGVFFVKFTHSPEYALKKTLSDFKENGYSGLRPHLSADVADGLDTIVSLGENKLIGGILSAVAGSDYAQELLNEASKIDWKLGEVLRGNEKASVTVSFSYEDRFSGSVDLEMTKEDGKWKISGMELPHFD